MLDITTHVRGIFTDAQHSMQARTKLVSRLQKVVEDSDAEEFFEMFTNCLKHSLVVFTRDPAVERTIDFIVAFATTESKGDRLLQKYKQGNGNLSDNEDEEIVSPFLTKLFHFLLDFHDSHAKAVRFRVCQIINKLFHGLDDEASIDEDLAGRVYDCMLVRLTDKFPAIRVQAVKAIYRLQDVQDPECPVIESFLHLMEKDSSPDVRRAALTSIAVTHRTVRAIIGRTKDVKDAVRKVAFEVLSEKVKIKSLTIAQRLMLLESGLNDRSVLVKKACTAKLLRAWLIDLNNQVPDLLKCLHVESSPESSVLTLKALFENQSIDGLKKHIEALKASPQVSSDSGSVLIQHSELGPELTLYWRVLAQHIKSLKDCYELMDDVLPVASEFCDYVQRFADSHKLFDKTGASDEAIQRSEFIMQQLLLLCGCFDYSDEIGRKRMQALIRKLFLDDNTPFTLVETLVARFNETETNEENFVQTLVEFISEIKEPMIIEERPRDPEETRRNEIMLAKLRIELNELREELDMSIKEENFSRAAEIKEQISKLEDRSMEICALNEPQNQTIRVEKSDPFTILKCLNIASEMLVRVQKRSLTPTIQSLADTLIWPSVQDADLLIRNAAIRCIGLIALLSKEFATANFVLFLQAAQIDLELVQITATKVIFDLILVYGFEAFEIDHAIAERVQGAKSFVEKTADEGGEEDEESISDILKENGEEKSQTSIMQLNFGADSTTSASSIILNSLVMLLDGESSDLRFVVAEGICKLLLSGRTKSSNLFTRLVLLWYNPAVADDFKLRQCLGVFLPNFALASRSNQELVEESFLQVMRTLFDAPDASPLAEVDPISVVELMVQLTSLRNREDHLKSIGNRQNIDQDTNVHDTMAVKVMNEILSKSENTDVRTLCKVLPMLDISAENDMLMKDLSILCERLQEEVDDKVSIKLIKKFQTSLGYEEKPENPEENFTFMARTEIVENCSNENSMVQNTVERPKKSAPNTARSMAARSSHKAVSQSRVSRSHVRKAQNSSVRPHSNDFDSDTSDSNDSDFKQDRRILSTRASKSAAFEKTKLNLESVLVDSEDDPSDDLLQSYSSD